MPILDALNLCPVQLLMFSAMTVFSLYSSGSHLDFTAELSSLFDQRDIKTEDTSGQLGSTISVKD